MARRCSGAPEPFLKGSPVRRCMNTIRRGLLHHIIVDRGVGHTSGIPIPKREYLFANTSGIPLYTSWPIPPVYLFIPPYLFIPLSPFWYTSQLSGIGIRYFLQRGIPVFWFQTGIPQSVSFPKLERGTGIPIPPVTGNRYWTTMH